MPIKRGPRGKYFKSELQLKTEQLKKEEREKVTAKIVNGRNNERMAIIK